MANLQLTFDDGPENVADLESIFATLSQISISAAFFVIGQEVASSPVATKRIVDKGHVLGNHSFEHLMPDTERFTDGEIKASFKNCHDQIVQATGTVPRHWRAPRLQSLSRLTRILTAGPSPLYTLSHCDVNADSKDSQGATTAVQMAQNILNDIAAQPGRTSFRLLFHVGGSTATALPTVLQKLKDSGHTFVGFSQSS